MKKTFTQILTISVGIATGLLFIITSIHTGGSPNLEFTPVRQTSVMMATPPADPPKLPLMPPTEPEPMEVASNLLHTSAHFEKNEAIDLRLGTARLQGLANSLQAATELSITALEAEDMAALDMGLVNVIMFKKEACV